MKNFLRIGVTDKNRQDLPVFYRLNGAVYAGRPDYIRKTGGFLGAKTFAYIMPRARSVDIDDETDFMIAECLSKTKAKRA